MNRYKFSTMLMLVIGGWLLTTQSAWAIPFHGADVTSATPGVALVVQDVNGDGVPDVSLHSSVNPPPPLAFAINQPGVKFAPGIAINEPGVKITGMVPDLNGDGQPDVVAQGVYSMQSSYNVSLNGLPPGAPITAALGFNVSRQQVATTDLSAIGANSQTISILQGGVSLATFTGVPNGYEIGLQNQIDPGSGLTTFLEGDPDRPLIIGQLYNGLTGISDPAFGNIPLNPAIPTSIISSPEYSLGILPPTSIELLSEQVSFGGVYSAALTDLVITNVPEPSTVVLATMGLLSLVAWGRRRQQR